jgi:hypothetical protein
MFAVAAKLGHLGSLLAVFAAVLAELALLGDGAVTGGMRTFGWSHGDLQSAF